MLGKYSNQSESSEFEYSAIYASGTLTARAKRQRATALMEQSATTGSQSSNGRKVNRLTAHDYFCGKKKLTIAVVLATGLIGSLLLVKNKKMSESSDETTFLRASNTGPGAAPEKKPSLNPFAIDLFTRIANEKDVFISPFSVAVALALAAKGATLNSKTASEFSSVLRASEADLLDLVNPQHTKEANVSLNLANSAWVSGVIKTEYQASVRGDFGADVYPLPKTPAPVNEWVKRVTQGMISNILDKIEPNTVALLLSAIFFKGQWTMAFDPKLTVDAKFYTKNARFYAPAGRGSHTVRMMNLRNQRFNYGIANLLSGRSVQMADLPYGSGTFAATVLLPDAKTSLDSVIGELRDGGISTWDKWAAGMSTTKLDVVQLPRFRLEYGQKSLKLTLQAMGLNVAFIGDNVSGAFGRMTDDKRVIISDVLHKAVVECTEEGTKAAAATALTLVPRSLPSSFPPSFIVNRPFLFVIRNRQSGEILFMGRIDLPKAPPS